MAAETPARRLRVIEDDPRRRWRVRLTVAALWLASLLATFLVLRETIAPQFADVARELAQARHALTEAAAEKSQLQREVAQHQRGEQVA